MQNNNTNNISLKDFFSKKIGNFTIFNHTEGDSKTSPLSTLMNNEKFISLKKILKKKESQLALSVSVLALVLSVSNMSEKDYKKDIALIKSQNTVLDILEAKKIENDLPDIISVDLESKVITIENKTETTEIDDLNTLTEEELFNLNWDFKTPSPKFKSYYTHDYNNSIPTQAEINEIENHYGIRENTIYYMAFKESKFDLDAKSEKNAKGLLGFLKETAEEFNLITKENDFIELKNGYATADAAARYLLWLNSYVNGYNADIFDQTVDHNGYDNLDYALASYNAGLSKIIVHTENKDGHKQTVYNDDGTKKVRIPNYKETKDYIRDIKMMLNNEGYIVEKNDTIQKISKKFNVHSAVIIRNNLDLSSNLNLKYGTVLNIVNNPEEEIEITVEKGFSISKIARKTGYNVRGLLTHNNLKQNSLIFIGDKIKLPPIDIEKLIADKNNKNNNKNI
jgi:LysM repeat protein/soluble lytic murein transglycosylase-like protein